MLLSLPMRKKKKKKGICICMSSMKGKWPVTLKVVGNVEQKRKDAHLCFQQTIQKVSIHDHNELPRIPGP